MDWVHGLPDAALSRTFAFVGADDLEAFCPCRGLVDHWGAAEMIEKVRFNGLPKGVRLSIFAFVGSHDLEANWGCDGCKPSWKNWYCSQCNHKVNVEQWTPRRHFGHCGQSCGCCRAELDVDGFGNCECCEDLICLSFASLETRRALNTYTGRTVVTQSVGKIYYQRGVLALLKRRWATTQRGAKRSRALTNGRCYHREW